MVLQVVKDDPGGDQDPRQDEAAGLVGLEHLRGGGTGTRVRPGTTGAGSVCPSPTPPPAHLVPPEPPGLQEPLPEGGHRPQPPRRQDGLPLAQLLVPQPATPQGAELLQPQLLVLAVAAHGDADPGRGPDVSFAAAHGGDVLRAHRDASSGGVAAGTEGQAEAGG